MINETTFHIESWHSVIEFFSEPLQFAFMQRAMLGVLLIGVTSGVMGAYVVTRGLSFLTDALAHSVLPGVAIVYLSGNTGRGAILLGGMVAGVLSGLGVGFLTRGRRLREDVAIGVIFAGMLAAGVAIISRSRNFATDLQHIIIGDILAIGHNDLLLIGVVGAVVLLMVLLFYKELLVVSFDPVLAETLRLPSEGLRMGLIVLLAVAIVMSTQGAGVLMATAMFTIPAATARFWTHRLHVMMAISAAFACVGGIIGMYLAWHLKIAASAAIVLTMTIGFALTFFFSPKRGYLWAVLGLTARKA